MSNAPVVTRFAPSPTGFLHIGGARTALFNWLFAKNLGGKMLLRIEDTDRARSTEEAVEAIQDGLKWLGLDWDGDAISQHANVARHTEIAHELLAKDAAYKCYATAEELAEMREKAEAEGTRISYDGRWRDRDPSEAPEGAPFVVRIKSPQSGKTVIDDQVQGQVTFPNKDLDDFVILRSDGTPTYMLAVVVDDHDMSVTHIIRGDDHLTNAARQAIIYQAMEWDMPVMAHISLIHGPDGAKLSKRHGALGVEAYREMGYLPQALRNYLVRLGWAHGDDEIMSTEQMIEWFGFDGMNKAAARFDFQKLESVNAHWIKNADDNELLKVLLETAQYLPNGEGFADKVAALGDASLLKLMPALKDRAKTLGELIDGSSFVFAQRPLKADEKATKILDDGGREVLAKLLPKLEALENWQAETIEALVREFADETELKLGKIAQPLRCATTGTTTSPAVFDVLGALSHKECIQRIKDQI